MLALSSIFEYPVSFTEKIIVSLWSADIFWIFIAKIKKKNSKTFHLNVTTKGYCNIHYERDFCQYSIIRRS